MRIDEMTLDQLLELNDVICQRIDELKEQETLQALSQLRVGGCWPWTKRQSRPAIRAGLARKKAK